MKKKKRIPDEGPLTQGASFCKKVTGNAEELQYLFPEITDYHSTWSSPEAFSRYIHGKGAKDAWCRDNAWTKSNEKFYGTKDMAEALHLADNGWKEGSEQAERVRNRIACELPKHARLVKYEIAGATPNVPRAIAGNIFNMKAAESSRSRKRPVITLISNMASNCGTRKEAFANRSAVIAALIDQIEGAGYACEVLAYAPSKNNSFYAATTVVVKRCDQPVDIKRLAFGLGHPAMFRRLVFADWQTEKSCQRGLGEWLGHSSSKFSRPKPEWIEKHIYCLPALEGNAEYYNDEETASTKGLKLVVDSLKEQGCPAFS